MLRAAALLLLALATPAAAAAEFRVEEVRSAAEAPVSSLKPGTVLLSEPKSGELADPVTGLLRFEDWARTRPAQKRLLSLYPDYVEPTINVTVHGVSKPYKEKLHIYVAA